MFFRRFALFTLIWCFCLVVIGAYVRLSDAGLGCPDWPGCYGHVGVPDAPHEVSVAEEKFPERPVEAPKAWKEMIHRYLASALGLFIIVLAGLASAGRAPPAVPRPLTWLLVGLVIFQGVLGMWTVTWQLKPLVVTAHLLGGMTTFALLLWLWLAARLPQVQQVEVRTRERNIRSERAAAFVLEREVVMHGAVPAPPPLSAGLRRFALLGLVVVVLQIFLGGWTSTNYAALACPDLPTCHGSYLPPLDLKNAFTLWHGLGINYEYGILDAEARVTIHYVHRLGALLVTVVLLLLAVALLRQPEALWRRFGAAVLAALTLQVTIGLSIVHWQLPLLLAAAHNLGAELLLGTLVALNFYAWRKPF